MLFVFAENIINTTEAYFTPSNDCQEQIIELINKSEKSIDIAIYSFTDEKIYNVLIDKKNKLRLVIDKQQGGNKKSKATLLLNDNVKGCYRKSGIMHNKYMIVDNRYVITGSYNWSDNARKSNNENCVVIDDIKIANDFTNNFNQLYNKYCYV